MKLSMSGHFRIEKRDAATGKLKDVREFDNLITNRGLDGYGDSKYGLLSYCYIGSGTAAPSVSDRSLNLYAGHTGYVSYRESSAVAPDYVSSITIVYRFTAGAVVGNFSEIGIGNVAQNPINDYLWSRALILNEQGVPSTITVLANEYLDVYYTLYFYLPLQSVVSFGVTVLGVSHAVTGKLANVSASRIASNAGSLVIAGGQILAVKHGSTALGDITGTVDGVEDDRSQGGYPHHPVGTLLPYVYGSYKCSSVFHFSLANDNYDDGISGLEFTTLVRNVPTLAMGVQYLISPPIPKNDHRELDLTFEWSWGRYGS